MIRNRGQFKWNHDASINNRELSTSRRPNCKFPKHATDYKSCANCLGSLTEKCLRPHWTKCTSKSIKNERNVKELSRATEGRIHPDASDDLSQIIFPKMREDACVRLIRFDWLVIEFGNDLCLNYFPIYQHALIRKKLRDAGKLLAAAKSISGRITDFSSLFHVKNCNTVVEAVRKVSNFDLKAREFGSPGTASTLVTLVNAIGDLLIIERMKQDDPIEEKNVERFLKVFQKEARLKINKLVGIQQAARKLKRNEDIPTTEDVYQLKTYLDDEREKCFDELSQGYRLDHFTYLSELTLASILVFNRRRTGETSNIQISDFYAREIITESDKFNSVPNTIRKLISSRMKIRGKLTKPVPVLLKHSFEKCLKLLLALREEAGISDANKFLFALPSESGIIRVINPCNVMRALSLRCNAKNPGSLRGTKLRKHMASLCATLKLTDSDVANVAKYMGHDDQIHRDIYRHNPMQREVVQMCSILETAQGGSVNINETSEELSEEEEEEEEEAETIVQSNRTKKSIRKTSKPQNRKRKLPITKRSVGKKVTRISKALEADLVDDGEETVVGKRRGKKNASKTGKTRKQQQNAAKTFRNQKNHQKI